MSKDTKETLICFAIAIAVVLVIIWVVPPLEAEELPAEEPEREWEYLIEDEEYGNDYEIWQTSLNSNEDGWQCTKMVSDSHGSMMCVEWK